MSTYKIESVQSTEIKVEAGKLQFATGFSKKECLESEILYFFENELTSSDMTEVIIHTVNPQGKSKNIKFYSSIGDSTVKEFLDYLASKRGSTADLRGKDPKEALPLMKAIDSGKLALILLPSVIMMVFMVFLAPMLLHGFDSGKSEVKANDILGGNKTGTSNLTISGHGLSEAMEYSVRRKGSTTVRTYFPLVDENWQSGEPIHILVEAGKLTDSEFEEILSRTTFSGVLQDKLWEGPHDDVIAFFKTQYGASFTEPVLLLDLDSTPGEYRIHAFGTIFIVVLVLAGLVFYTKFKK